MAEISKIALPNGVEYDIKDTTYTAGDGIDITGDTISVINPAGVVQMYAGTVIPDGWLQCNGAQVAIEDYPQLYAAIGDTYGIAVTDGNFVLPDLEGRVVIGAGLGTATDATNHLIGSAGGEETHTLTTDEMAAHTHGSEALTGSVSIRDCGTAAGYNTIMTNRGIVKSIVKEVWSGSHDALSTRGVTNPNTQKMTIDATHEHTSVGLDQAHNNMQPYLTMHYIISTGK